MTLVLCLIYLNSQGSNMDIATAMLDYKGSTGYSIEGQVLFPNSRGKSLENFNVLTTVSVGYIY